MIEVATEVFAICDAVIDHELLASRFRIRFTSTPAFSQNQKQSGSGAMFPIRI